jgi:hypothetical protein
MTTKPQWPDPEPKPGPPPPGQPAPPQPTPAISEYMVALMAPEEWDFSVDRQ